MMGFAAIVRATFAALLIAAAAPDARAQQAPLQDKPFAEHKIVLQLSDNDARKQGLVLSVASNLMKHYDPDKVAIEIVAFGPGIDLLRPENPNRKMVESLGARVPTSAPPRCFRGGGRAARGRSSSPRRRRCRSASRRSCC